MVQYSSEQQRKQSKCTFSVLVLATWTIIVHWTKKLGFTYRKIPLKTWLQIIEGTKYCTRTITFSVLQLSWRCYHWLVAMNNYYMCAWWNMQCKGVSVLYSLFFFLPSALIAVSWNLIPSDRFDAITQLRSTPGCYREVGSFRRGVELLNVLSVMTFKDRVISPVCYYR